MASTAAHAFRYFVVGGTKKNTARKATAKLLLTTGIHSVQWKNPFPAWSVRLNVKLPKNPPKVRKTTQRPQSSDGSGAIRSSNSSSPTPVYARGAANGAAYVSERIVRS